MTLLPKSIIIGGFLVVSCADIATVALNAATYLDMNWPPHRLLVLYRALWVTSIVVFLLIFLVSLVPISWLPQIRSSALRLGTLDGTIAVIFFALAMVNAFFLCRFGAVRVSPQGWEAARGRFDPYVAISPAEAAEQLRQNIRWITGGCLCFEVILTLLLFRIVVALFTGGRPGGPGA